MKIQEAFIEADKIDGCVIAPNGKLAWLKNGGDGWFLFSHQMTGWLKELKVTSIGILALTKADEGFTVAKELP